MGSIQSDSEVTISRRRQLTPEQKQRQNELRRLRRAQLTPEQREDLRVQERRRRAEITREQRDSRNEAQRNRRAQASAVERDSINRGQNRRRSEQRQRPGLTYNSGRDPSFIVEEIYLGQMNFECECCGAYHFQNETRDAMKFSSCCEKGKVELSPFNPYPDLLLSWLTANDNQCKHFRNNVREYNNAFAFATFGYTPARLTTNGPPVFAIHGQWYHQTALALDSNNENPSFSNPVYAKLYFLDPEFANNARQENSHNKGCKADVFFQLDSLMRSVNPFAQAFQMMKEVIQENQTEDISMWIIKDRTQDPRRYNLPVANEVAAVFTSEEGQPPDTYQRDICVHPRGTRNLQYLSPISPNCDPMTYPILFPHGDAGWQIKQTKAKGKLTQQDYYSFRLQERFEFSPILHAGKLTQQFVVDAFLKVEGGRLLYQREKQDKLRVHLYMGLMDFVNSQAAQRGMKAGKVCILPSSFVGSKRNLQQHYQDAMTMVAVFGKPDLFITFTCNPNWREIQQELKPYETALDRPDIVATVFHLKLKDFIKDLTQNHVLGKVKGYILVIEFQKRGLPHCHMLFILEDEDKLREPEDFDSVVCAEIPDSFSEPELHNIVSTSMIHGPCGTLNPNAPCMDEIDGVSQCTKRFPKSFCGVTNTSNDGYPEYRRREDGKIIEKSGQIIDNRWVVPYNPYLCRKYNAHINVEVCSTVKSVKYIFKYVYKGHDAAVIKVNETGQDQLDWDEITSYINARYIAAPEAMWRLREYKMQDHSHAVIRLAIHLPLQQNVVFVEGAEEEALEKAGIKRTTLQAWFELNIHNVEARKYLYKEIPFHFTFDKKDGVWNARKKHMKILSRMYAVSPKDLERYSLRLLLLHVRGAKSFEDLRTVNGVLCETFVEAAKLLNLLEDDDNWNKTMEEACQYQMPSQMRMLLATIFLIGEPTNPRAIYFKFRDALMEDYLRNHDEEYAEQKSLEDIESHLLQFGKDCLHFGLPAPKIEEDSHITEPIIHHNSIESERLILLMNKEQRDAFNMIMDSVDEKVDHKCFFLSGVGGSGKTFVYRTLISANLARGDIVKVVAPTGLAATLLKNGQTVHSGFRLPINLNETSTSNIVQGSKEWKFLKSTKLIIWDEISMCTATIFNVVDRSLRDLLDPKKPFGGITIVVGGDFRQQAPVVKHGNRVKIVESCVKSSKLWREFKELSLTKNMRVNVDETEFSDWLLKIGAGIDDNNQKADYIALSDEILTKDIIGAVFGSDFNSLTTDDLASRAILCPKNDDTLRINENILSKLEGEPVTYHSIDTISNCESEEEQMQYPMEFLNSLTPMGMPPHALNLKTGCCVMLMRNLNPKQGLCNGTRLTVVKLGNNIIECSIFSGDNKGSNVFIPRICMDTDDTDIPFQLRRKQFPLRLAYSMTITKSQGQTFDSIGLYLPQPVFTHGQLYTALSRVKSKGGLKIEIVSGSKQGKIFENDFKNYTFNCVYRELL